MAVRTPTKEKAYTLYSGVGLAGQFVSLCDISQGTDSINRVGRTIKVFGIKLKAMMYKGGATRGRIMLVRARGVITSLDMPPQMNSVPDAEKYHVLCDKLITFGTTDYYRLGVDKLFKNLPGQTVYDSSTTGDIESGGYYLWFLTDDAGGTPTALSDGHVRLFFKDVALKGA